MTKRSQLIAELGACLLALACVSCATPAERAGYDAFLDRIAQDCRPLVIGSENVGQALISNGVGADPDHYGDFLSATKALYYGNIPADVYRTSITAQLGGGPNNDRSVDCIVAHLPKS
jgi:hypothetical protein